MVLIQHYFKLLLYHAVLYASGIIVYIHLCVHREGQRQRDGDQLASERSPTRKEMPCENIWRAGLVRLLMGAIEERAPPGRSSLRSCLRSHPTIFFTSQATRNGGTQQRHIEELIRVYARN